MNKLLLIHPDPKFVGIYKKALVDHFRIDSAHDGLAGLRLINKNAPHIIISDYHLPLLSGLSLLIHVRQHPHLHSIPFIFLSQDQATNESLSHGATDWLMIGESNPDLLAQKCFVHLRNKIYV